MKSILEDPNIFKKKYITQEIKDASIPAFNIGTYFHTAILEPEKLEAECAVWEGTRRGKAWEEFELANKGKAIITKSELPKAENCIKAVQNSVIAQDIFSKGEAEVSLFVELEGLRIKVRADWINFEDGYIDDLKSTTGNCLSMGKIKNSISDYEYALSAALYLDAFNEYLKKDKDTLLKNFYWTFASKDRGNCKTYQASEELLRVGRAKYKEAIRLIKYYEKLNWEIPEDIGVVQANVWDVKDWLEPKGEKKVDKRFNNKPIVPATRADRL